MGGGGGGGGGGGAIAIAQLQALDPPCCIAIN